MMVEEAYFLEGLLVDVDASLIECGDIHCPTLNEKCGPIQISSLFFQLAWLAVRPHLYILIPPKSIISNIVW